MSWQTITKENKLDISVIDFSELSERIDAEYYKPMFLVSNALIENKKSKKLSELADIKGGKRLPKGQNFSNEGISYIRAEDVKNGFVDYENAPKISMELHQKLKSYQTKYDDVLITIVGNSIGDVGIVKFDLKKCNLTENCAKLVNLKEINADYLFSFLLSKYGQHQIEREKVGTSQPKLALVRIRDFTIPVPSDELQKHISVLISKAKDAKDASVKEYKEAEQMLLKEINLEGYKGTDEAISVRNFSEAMADNRFDAEYWQPKYDEIIKHLTKLRYKTLGECSGVVKGINTDYTNDSKYRVIKTKQLKNNYIDIESIEDESEKGITIKNNDVVFASMGVGSLGKVDIFYDDFYNADKFVIDSTLVIFRDFKKNILPEYVLTLFRTSIFQELIYRYIVGSTGIISISKPSIESLPIPIIDMETQVKIRSLVKRSHADAAMSKTLLEKAKRAVEIFIEEDEKSAIRYLTKTN